MDRAPFLFVGFQRGVLPAWRRSGRPAYALVPDDRLLDVPDELEGVRGVDLHGGFAEIERAARELLGGVRPAAVVALAERTVVVSAMLREAFGLAGNRRDVALACADKLRMKCAAREAGIRVTEWREIGPETVPHALVEALGLPLVIKPRRDSGGRGQIVVRDAAAVAPALAHLADDGHTHGSIAETWIEGEESSVECFVAGGEVLFTNTTEYLVPRHANLLPSALDEGTRRALGDFAARAIQGLGVERGITHMEVFRTERGIVFGELAIRPPGGRLMTLLKRAWGFDPWEALLRIELGEVPEFPAEAQCVAGVYILHPGHGHVLSIEGVGAARATEHVRKVHLKVEPGDFVAERVGSGQDIGAIYADGPTRDEVAEALISARRALRIELA